VRDATVEMWLKKRKVVCAEVLFAEHDFEFRQALPRRSLAAFIARARLDAARTRDFVRERARRGPCTES